MLNFIWILDLWKYGWNKINGNLLLVWAIAFPRNLEYTKNTLRYYLKKLAKNRDIKMIAAFASPRNKSKARSQVEARNQVSFLISDRANPQLMQDR